MGRAATGNSRRHRAFLQFAQQRVIRVCVLAIARGVHPDYPLVFAGNRDEYHRRAAAAADWWDGYPNIFGGRDLVAGGTWLALNRTGRFAVVTNRPGLTGAAGVSRGRLVLDFLTADLAPAKAVTQLEKTAATFGGFGLLAGDASELWVIAREGEPTAIHANSLADGVHGLSNSPLAIAWPKQQFVANGITDALTASVPDTERLFALLAQRDPVVANAPGPTGTPFVLGPDFGTRASTVILIHRNGETRFIERRFDAAGRLSGETDSRFEVIWDSA